MQTINLYCPNVTPRHNYIFDFVFKNYFGIKYRYAQKNEIVNINYSNENIFSDFTIVPNNLLDQKLLIKRNIQVHQWSGCVAFFKTSDFEIDFDIFSAIFFLITRYEEYFNEDNSDDYHRFSYKNSTAFKYGFLDKPLVEIWLQKFAKCLSIRYPKLVFKKHNFEYLPTIDIDIAFKYLSRSFVRNFFATLKSPKTIMERIKVYNGKKDPYNVFEKVIEDCKKNNLDICLFILIGNYGGNDKSTFKENIYWKNLKELFDANKIFKIGLHPSIKSTNHKNILQNEINRFDSFFDKKVEDSRQHYLCLYLPETYTQLLQNNIKNDYTMGYSDCIGFRASYSKSYYWYNLFNEQQEDLLIHPFYIMDVCLTHFMKLPEEEIISIIKDKIYSLKKINSTLMTCFHNNEMYENNFLIWDGFIKNI